MVVEKGRVLLTLAALGKDVEDARRLLFDLDSMSNSRPTTVDEEG
jgi:hypothetical protein